MTAVAERTESVAMQLSHSAVRRVIRVGWGDEHAAWQRALALQLAAPKAALEVRYHSPAAGPPLRNHLQGTSVEQGWGVLPARPPTGIKGMRTSVMSEVRGAALATARVLRPWRAAA